MYKVVKDFAGTKGVAGFTFLTPRFKPVYDNAFIKTYALMEEMGLPLVFHAGLFWGRDQGDEHSATASSRRMRWASRGRAFSIAPIGW